MSAASAGSARALSATAFATLLLIALMMGGNHVAARIAFNNGVDVATAVVFRSTVTALVVMGLLLAYRVRPQFTPRHKRYLPVIGLLIGIQSLCLYSSVARLPVALALLAFNTYPIWTALWAFVVYREPPARPMLIAMPVILVGLALALDVFGAASGPGAAGQWGRIGAGVAFALAAAATFGLALVFTQHEAGGLTAACGPPAPWHWLRWWRCAPSPCKAVSICPPRRRAGAGWRRSPSSTAPPSPSCSPCCRAWVWWATRPS